MRDSEIFNRLEKRLGIAHAQRRLAIESSHEARVFRARGRFFHLENWYSVHAIIRASLKLTGLYQRARRNALDVHVVENHVELNGLPEGLDGLRMLHLSDLHVDMNEEIVHVVIERVRQLDYDLCVMTGDYRYRTFGDIDAVIHGMQQLRASLAGPTYAVLGNHDSVAMLPELEAMGIRVLMNESQAHVHNGARLYVAGIDDAHYFRVGDVVKALAGVPPDSPRLLLSHTPEIYRRAQSAGVHLLLSGHTHGGQICLPGGHAVMLDARVPRRFGRGAWQFRSMKGYTSAGVGSSIVAVRLNCPPEITVHVLHAAR